jgi:McbB family protein
MIGNDIAHQRIEMYFIRPFGLVHGVDGVLLLAPHSSVRVTEEKMIGFLSGNIGDKAKTFCKDDLVNSLETASIDPVKGINFLQQTGILEIISEKEADNSPFDKCLIISDKAVISKTLESSLLYDGVNNIASYHPDHIPADAYKSGTLVVLILENYLSQTVRDLYASCSSLANVGFIQSYYFRHEFKIDGLFIPSIGSPCHFCHIERWHSRERRSFGSNKNSWHQVVELLNKYGKSIPPSIPLTDCDRYFAAQVLRRRIQQLVGVPVNRAHLDNFISSVSVDLIKCNVASEPVPHWHSCDCLKG